MQIDWSQLRTPEALASEELRAREDAARAECRRRIVAVVPETSQMNVAAAAAAGILSEAQMQVYRAGLAWISAMRNAWPDLAAQGVDLFDDDNWPAVPEGIEALAEAF